MPPGRGPRDFAWFWVPPSVYDPSRLAGGERYPGRHDIARGWSEGSVTRWDASGNVEMLLSTAPNAPILARASQVPEVNPSERYAEIFRAHYGRVVRWLSVLGVQPGDVDDVAQEVFIVAHRKLDQLRPDASVTGWLLGISRRVGATARRGRQRARARQRHAAPPAESPDPETVVMRNRAAQLLQDFLATLPEEQRLVFALYEFDGCSATEVGEALGVSPNTVHSRVRLIRQKLARVVERHRARAGARDV